MVRKLIALFGLIGFIIFSSIYIIKDKENIKTVFNKSDEYYYDIYLVDISDENINTKNIFNYFSDIEILKIYPYNNPIYSKFINIDEYEFDNILSSKKNISNFVNTYNERLKKNALIKEVELFNISGIKLNKLKIYTTEEQINKLKGLLPKIKVELINDN